MALLEYNNDTYIPVSELWGICQNINSISYLMQDMEEDYFQQPLDSKKEIDKCKIAWDFPRMRAKAHAISLLVEEIKKDLKSNGVFVYEDKTA